MLGAFVASFVLLAGQDRDPLLSVVKEPSGRNGYEEYVAAAIRFKALGGRAIYDEVEGLRGSPEFLKGATTFSRRTDAVYGLVAAGNGKAVVHPEMATADFDLLLPELAEGGVRKAFDEFLAGMCFARKVKGAGMMIHELVAEAMTGLMELELSRMVPPDLASAQKVGREVSALLEDVPLGRSQQAETALLLRTIERSDIEALRSSLFLGADDVANLPVATLEAAVRRHAELHGEASREFGGILDGPEREWLPRVKALRDRLASVRSDIPALAYDGGMLWSTTLLEVRSRTQLRLMRLWAAVWEHRWDRGAFPVSLSELEDQTVVFDPLTGVAFEYRLEDGRFEVWSRGTSDTGEIRLGKRGRMPGQEDSGGEILPPEGAR